MPNKIMEILLKDFLYSKTMETITIRREIKTTMITIIISHPHLLRVPIMAMIITINSHLLLKMVLIIKMDNKAIELSHLLHLQITQIVQATKQIIPHHPLKMGAINHTLIDKKGIIHHLKMVAAQATQVKEVSNKMDMEIKPNNKEIKVEMVAKGEIKIVHLPKEIIMEIKEEITNRMVVDNKIKGIKIINKEEIITINLLIVKKVQILKDIE
jgi:hypothetical protein